MPKDMLIQHQLKRLRLPTIGRQYRKLAQEAARDNRPYEDFLLSLLEAEVAQRVEYPQAPHRPGSFPVRQNPGPIRLLHHSLGQ